MPLLMQRQSYNDAGRVDAIGTGTGTETCATIGSRCLPQRGKTV